MKKFIAALFVSSLVISACHYGQDEAKETLQTNEQYKSDKVDYSTNRGNDGVMPENKKAETAPVAASADSTAKK